MDESFLFHRKDCVALMCESKVEKGLSHETKCTSCKDAFVLEREERIWRTEYLHFSYAYKEADVGQNG